MDEIRNFRNTQFLYGGVLLGAMWAVSGFTHGRIGMKPLVLFLDGFNCGAWLLLSLRWAKEIYVRLTPGELILHPGASKPKQVRWVDVARVVRSDRMRIVLELRNGRFKVSLFAMNRMPADELIRLIRERGEGREPRPVDEPLTPPP